jgi:peptidoglycan-N-acetylglucosamine deacetylase
MGKVAKMRRLARSLIIALIVVPLPLGAHWAAASTECPRGVVALTFDDGPGPYTPALLDVLAAREAPATFFVMGRRVAAAPAVVRRQCAEGHVVGNHTYNHEQLTRVSDPGIRSTVDATANAIASAGARQAPLVRPPGGATSTRVRQVLHAMG